MTVVLIGPPGSGKTKLGKRVAKALGLPFIDTDKRVVAEHGPIADIFGTHGEPHFRDLERAAVIEALAEDAVVSLGGGAILDEGTQRDLDGRLVALITVSAEAVVERLEGDKRPLVTGIESWQVLVDARRETYERLASRTWDTSHRPLDAIAEEIAQWASEGRQ
ncbi:MAG: shikimate kinase [Actinomycetota bacterium]|jgi:shikimate kinase|nr:shikimate kinase [Actinomycetota bacterium]